MKVAIVHDWLIGLRGGERCLQAFLQLFPEADLFTLLHVPGSTTAEIDARVKHTSFLQQLPGATRLYRHFLPLYPAAIRRFNFSAYDVVISLSHAAAKNISVPKGVLHFSYCFTPMRYIWDQSRQYFGKATPFLWPLLSSLRSWDVRASKRVDCIVAISEFIAARVRCYYNREAEVIYPPVDTSWIEPLKQWRQGAAFLCAGALVPYKRIDLAVEAFNRLGEPLWIAGSGPEQQRLKRIAKSNITFFGSVSDQELAGLYRSCRALIFPGTEDFGLMPIECLASGRPVIARYDGALRETLTGLKSWESAALENQDYTGVFIPKRAANEVESLMQGVNFFLEREDRFSAEACSRHARVFEPSRFFEAWEHLLTQYGVLDRRMVSGYGRG